MKLSQRTWALINSDSQIRWLGPKKGVIHLAAGALINAVWDLYAKAKQKPLWRLLGEMSPEQLLSCIDFSYITEVLTKEEGWKHIKMKVGSNLQDDLRKAAIIREEIGDEMYLMMDANQRWEVDEAIENLKALAQFKPLWIEEPTRPDDIFGHKTISDAVKPILVATREHGQNRVIFKQLIKAGALQICQIDSCPVTGVNENLAIMLIAKKNNVPICPHVGVGLCEYVQPLSMLDFIFISGTMENRVIEYVGHLHEHFIDPVKIKNGKYQVPTFPGYSIKMKPQSLKAYDFNHGQVLLEEIHLNSPN
ncbi:enolase C-terminal domain-like protein [Echinicola jeungdonensis]|uniref:Enolase C-terminal domain-like protein n=1 Tax=Echinicola jeungdonensis TaxID=709343 RepID=A0ABV5J5U9_9BACT|nr:enolase C-terminal domain-like protein [Echinicola jeungdonensis]MDN3670953.1 enolase C-terminal domain-like protein [Echinicola jeungdonensis]